MPKLTTINEYRKDGSTSIKGYRTSFSKVEIEKNELQDKEFNVEYFKDKIILKVKKPIS